MTMIRYGLVLTVIVLTSVIAACGGGAGTSGGGGGGGTPQDIPTLSAIAPSSTTAGASAVSLVLYGSNFENGATALWNGTALSSSWVSATEMTATIPASDVASAGNAKVTVANPSPGGGNSAAETFTIAAAPAATNWVRAVAGVATPQDVIWDASHGRLYVSIASTDTTIPNSIVTINPVTGTTGRPMAAGNNPDLLSISSDFSYLWVGLDGDNVVQRFLLPGLTKDISFSVPLDSSNKPQQAVSLQAAPVSPHTVALVAGHWQYSPVGEGVYVYDDATQRPTSVPGFAVGGPTIDWTQWGANDSTMYGNQYTTIDAGGVATLNVTSSGVSLASYQGGQVGPPYFSQYDASNGLLYSLGEAFSPTNGTLVGSFNFPLGTVVCTADPSLARYYCFVTYNLDGTDVTLFELWIFDLNTYALLNRVYFGASAGLLVSPITGTPTHLVRWGNAGLALTTSTYPYVGNGGLFLIDGAAINPNAAPDISSGTPANPYAWMASLMPQRAPVGGGDVSVTINGSNFTQGSTACWSCSYLQFQYLPTSYVSSRQLNVTIPASLMANPGPLPISVFDANSNLFSSNSLTFTVTAASSGSTQMTAVNLAGFAMASDANSSLLYVGTADYDGAYPNSIVTINGQNGSIVKTVTVEPDPDLVSVTGNTFMRPSPRQPA
jgi:trimeric autotransporter adhesin